MTLSFFGLLILRVYYVLQIYSKIEFCKAVSMDCKTAAESSDDL